MEDLRQRNQNVTGGSTPRPRFRRIAAVVLSAGLGLGPMAQAQAPAGDPAPAPAAEDAAETPVEGGRIVGKVSVGRGIEATVPGSRVLAYHVDDGREYASEPLSRNGEFSVVDLPRGYFDLAVETPEGLFVSSEIVHLAPGAKVRIEFTLGPYPGGEPPPERATWAGGETPGTGLADASRKLRGRDFWKSPAGIAILAGGGGAAILGIALNSDDDERFASPF